MNITVTLELDTSLKKYNKHSFCKTRYSSHEMFFHFYVADFLVVADPFDVPGYLMLLDSGFCICCSLKSVLELLMLQRQSILLSQFACL